VFAVLVQDVDVASHLTVEVSSSTLLAKQRSVGINHDADDFFGLFKVVDGLLEDLLVVLFDPVVLFDFSSVSHEVLLVAELLDEVF